MNLFFDLNFFENIFHFLGEAGKHLKKKGFVEKNTHGEKKPFKHEKETIFKISKKTKWHIKRKK